MTTMEKAEHKNLGSPDETRTFEKGVIELVHLDGGPVGRMILQPGWKWSDDVKPIAQTESCLVPHAQYIISGRLAIRMDDGDEFVLGPGDVADIPPGHDGWVVGDEPVVGIDWTGFGNYAKA